MSGDVQPRKRKDKKRKKEENTEHVPLQPPSPTGAQNEDLNIHIHKEDGTGGGICAKIIFFLLFSALAVLIGLIITEHRGLTDLDVVETESRFSHLFEGWVDNSLSHDDDHGDDDHIVSSLEEEDHEESHEEEEEEEEEEEAEEEETEASEETTHAEEEEEEEEEEDEDEGEASEETPQTEEEEEEDESELKDADEEDEEQDVEKSVEEEEEEEQEDEDEEEEEKAVSEEVKEEEKEEEEEAAEEPEVEEKVEEEEVGDEQNSKTSPIETPPKDELPDLARRNTIVVPPKYEEVEQDIEENIEEEYSDEDGDVESEEEEKLVKVKYQELRTTYTRSLTPESEPEYQNKPDEEYEDEEEEIEDEEEDEEESEEDDDDLLQRLESKYGKLQREENEDEQFSSWKRVNVREDNEPEESDSDKQSDYEYENITSKDDYQIKEKLDEAHKSIQNNTAYALKLFDALLQNYSSSPRSLYGKAQALDVLAEQKRSNELLQKAIDAYLKILELKDVPNVLFEAAAERCINRMRFIGNYNRAIEVHYKLIARFPQKTHHRNQLVVSLLTINRVNTARQILQETLSKNPNDGFALVHYGFILKTVDNNLNESISYLERGISTRAPGVVDGRFYFHLGDALARVGRTKDAMNVYQDGVRNNLFLSKYQRSLYNVARLKGQPWWKKEETPYLNLFQALETNWKQIRAEGISVLNKDGHFQAESENLKDTGDWKQFELFARGHKNINNCKKCPLTCKIIESVPDAKGCKRGQTKFSVMHPGTHVWPHCGPTNCRLRVHLGLQVPANTFIRVAEKTRSWKEGEVLVFDDSFEHEVWHNGTSLRLVLIVDVWHPELTPVEKRTLSPI
ncbi:aspartyl/asparaginyl beta-hydroxylase isoform X2 [Tribolium madens]|uniref:aspartyl/asparaginyl beta-hydroxylase isoform X2 n=1 Tax=Tribolium madens TaxID=41895 RepID=UPI001CF761F4|nr:aspartyl/asparaginyl beta-hydroxylase isoform X2 [Tribolium madens]